MVPYIGFFASVMPIDVLGPDVLKESAAYF